MNKRKMTAEERHNARELAANMTSSVFNLGLLRGYMLDALHDLRLADAENDALVEAIQGLISADTLEEKNRAQCAALDLINPLPEGGRDFHALEKR